MSEYQSYEFRAIDRSLTPADMAALRQITSRAEINPGMLSNEYHFGDFKGNPEQLVRQYFDVFVHYANWGTHWCIIKLPRSAWREEWSAYGDWANDETGGHILVGFYAEEEPDDYEEGGWIDQLLGLRQELLAGDARPLYLAWLAFAGGYESDPLEEPPPVPSGLADLTPAQEALAEFLYLDPHLLEVAAAESSDAAPEPPGREELVAWIASLPAETKDGYLLRLVEDDPPHLGLELRSRFARETAQTVDAAASRYPTVAEMLDAAAAAAEESRRREAEERERERLRREEEDRRKHEQHLLALEARGEAIWDEVVQLIELKQSKSLDQAVALLVELRDLAAWRGLVSDFEARVADLRERFGRRPGLMNRMDRAGL